jgi:hypothetical protein
MTHGNVATQWSPVTLQGAGLFHMAMGAVIGVAAFGRTQEKLAGATTNSTSTPTPSFGAPSAPAFGTTPTPPASGGFGSGFNSGFGATPVTTTPVVSTGFGGKKAPAPQDDPPL